MALDAQDPGIAQKSRQLYEAAYELARARGDKAAMARALIATEWFTDFWAEYRDQAAANAREALALSQEAGDGELIIEATTALFSYQSFQESERGAEELLVRLLREGDLLRAKELYFRLMWFHLQGGNFLRCVECCDAGIELASRMGVPPVQYPTLKALALLQLGRYDAAWQALQGEVADEEHPFGKAFQSHGLGMYLLELAAHGKASAVFQKVVEESERLGRAWLKAWGQVALAQSLAQVQPLDEARLQALAQDLVNVRETLADRTVGIALSAIALAVGNPQEALQEAQRAATEAHANGARPSRAAALELELRALLELNRPAEALPLAEEGLRLATEMSYRPMEWRLHAAKAQALGKLGETDAAAQEYERAAAILRELADTIPDAELRQGFLADPLAASVIKGAGPIKDE
jgi:tetratricopeptide (TPR) repeat protein